MSLKLSKSDQLLLESLQRDASQSQQDLADNAGLSKTSCWRRLREFEDMGLIRSRNTILDPRTLGLQIHVLLSVSMIAHNEKTKSTFEKYVQNLGEVTECYSVSGDWDYLLHVRAADIEGYNEFLNRCILQHDAVKSASSSFTLQEIKYTTELQVRR